MHLAGRHMHAPVWAAGCQLSAQVGTTTGSRSSHSLMQAPLVHLQHAEPSCPPHCGTEGVRCLIHVRLQAMNTPVALLERKSDLNKGEGLPFNYRVY